MNIIARYLAKDGMVTIEGVSSAVWEVKDKLSELERMRKIMPEMKAMFGGDICGGSVTDAIEEAYRANVMHRFYGGAKDHGTLIGPDDGMDALRYMAQQRYPPVINGDHEISKIWIDETTHITKKQWECLMNRNIKYGIRNIKKVKLGKKTTVELTDGRKGVVTLNPVDVPDPYVAFALAYTKAQFETSTAFYNFVDRIVKKNKRYGIFIKGKKLKALNEKTKRR